MSILVMAEIMSALFVGISLIGQIIGKDESKSSKSLRNCSYMMLLWLFIDILSYGINGPVYPMILVWIINILAYTIGSVAFIFFIRYCYVYISEQMPISSWQLIAPALVAFFNIIVILVYIAGGKILVFENGYMTSIGGIPTFVQILNICILVYIPVLAFSKRHTIGTKAVFLLGVYGVAPIAAIIVLFITGTDFTVAFSAISIVVAASMLQKDEARRKLEELNIKLADSNKILTDVAEEQEIQLEEIRELNASTEERMQIIQSMCKVYFSSYYIDIPNNHFIELSDLKHIRAAIGVQGNAQESLNYMCDNLIQPEYSKEMKKFVDLSTLNKRMGKNKSVTFEYIGMTTGWSRAYLIEGDRDENGNICHVFFATRTIHDEKEREEEQKRKIHEAYGIIEGFCYEYNSMWLVDKETLQLQFVRSDSNDAIFNAIQMAKETPDYNTASIMYIDNYVEPADVERMKKQTEITEVLEQLEKNNSYSVNYLRRDENGQVAYHQITFVNADTKDGKRQFVFAFRDVDHLIKEEKAKKSELVKAKQAAEVANQAKTAFLNNMSHDIRTPLNVILGFARLMENKLDEPETISDYLSKIEESGEYLLSLINGVLDMARIESGKMELDEDFVDLKSDIVNINKLFENEAGKKNITLTCERNIKNQYVFMDVQKAKEVIMNIVSNAIHYTNAGGYVKCLMEEIECNREGFARIRIKVQDNGIGMSKEFQSKLFESFTREHNSTDSKVIGTGLGMSIVKSYVDIMGGTVEVDSELGKGSTFTVTWDFKIVENPEDYIAEVEDVAGDVNDTKGRRILLAEDNDLNAEIAIEILKEAEITVERAADGALCVEMLEKADLGYYDAILMDIQMPNMDGYEATRAIRQLPNTAKANIPIIAMTANAFEEDRKRAFEAGMNEHIAKPIDVKKLFDALYEAVVSQNIN